MEQGQCVIVGGDRRPYSLVTPSRTLTVPLPIDVLIGRYDSFDALLAALEAGLVPLLPAGGYVRVHPTRLAGVVLADRIGPRERLAAFGLTLVLTEGASPDWLELRGYTRPPWESPGSTVGARPD
jgi:hypothetical protein